MNTMHNKSRAARYTLLVALMTLSVWVGAQPSVMPDGATQVLPEMGVLAPRSASSAPLPDDLKPRKKLMLKPHMNSDELKPEMQPGFKPEMSPGLQPNSQKPLHTDAPTRRGGGPAN